MDTNVLVYAFNPDSPESDRCAALLESWRAGPEPWGTTWGVFYEFLRVATHPRVLPRPLTPAKAWSVVESILGCPSFQVFVHTDRHSEFASRTLSEIPFLAGNIFHDAHIAILMREHGVRRIYTRDTGFHRFPFLEVVDPLAPGETGRG